jgi:hypothetical protein
VTAVAVPAVTPNDAEPAHVVLPSVETAVSRMVYPEPAGRPPMIAPNLDADVRLMLPLFVNPPAPLMK